MPVEQAGKIWRVTGIKSFKGERGNFKLDANVDGQPVKFLQDGGTRINISFACNNACEGILSALETRNVFSRNAIQNNQAWWRQEQRQWYGWLNDQVSHEYALGHECDKSRISRLPWCVSVCVCQI